VYKALAVPNDTYYPLQWHYQSIKLPQAWDVMKSAANVVVAVVDTGVSFTHPDLQGILSPDMISSTKILIQQIQHKM